MDDKIKNLSKNMLLFTISSFGTKILSFLLVPLYTYVLLAEEYGMVDLITTTVQLLIPMLTLNIQDAVLRYTLDKEYESDEVINIGLKIVFLSSLILGSVLLLAVRFDLIKIKSNYLLFLYVSYIVGALNNNLTMYLKAKNEIKTIAVWGVINTFVTCMLNLVLLLVLKVGINGYMIANISGVFIANIGMYINGKVYSDIKFRKYNNRGLTKKLLQYSTPLVANSISWWINNASDRYILTFFCGVTLNGIYAVSYKIPSILSTIQSFFYNAWSISAITEFDEEDSDGFIGNTYSRYSMFLIWLCSIILCLNIMLAKILYSKEYFQAWKYVPYLLVGTVFNGLGLFEGCIFTAVKKTKEVSKTTILGAIINILFNFILIPVFGASGASVATMLGYIAIWGFRTLSLRSIIRMKINWKKQGCCIFLLIIQAIVATETGNSLYQIPFFIGISLLQFNSLRKFRNKKF